MLNESPGVKRTVKDQREAETERINAHADYGVVIAKRPRRPIGESYVVMTLDSFAQLLKEIE